MTTRRTEFVDDVILYSKKEPTFQENDEEDEHFTEEDLSPEEWHDWNSEYLMDMYLGLVGYCEDNHFRFMNNITFHSFCEFILAANTK